MKGAIESVKKESKEDLFMAPVIREYWVNVYRSRGTAHEVYTGAQQYTSKTEAEIQGRYSGNYLNTVLLHKEES